MDEVLRQSAPAIFALLAVMGMVGVALIVRRRMSGGSRKAIQKREKLEKREREIEQAAQRAMGPPTKRLVHPEAVREATGDFDLDGFLTWARALFVSTQHARTEDPGSMKEHLLPGAIEVVMAAGPGLESTTEVQIRSLQLVKANGTVDGCDVRLVIQAQLHEVRDGSPAIAEVREEWRFGWPPGLRRWRLLQVERLWRRPLQPAILHREGHLPAALPDVAPDLEAQLEAHEVDVDALEAVARLAVEAWSTALSGRPEAADGLVKPTFRQGIEAEIARHAAFDMTIRWSVDVGAVTPCRVMSDGLRVWVAMRAVGTQCITLVGPGELEHEEADLPWARYLEFEEAGDGRWLLVEAIGDEEWVV